MSPYFTKALHRTGPCTGSQRKPRRRARAWTATVVALALAITPVAPPLHAQSVTAPAPQDSGELRKYGPIPPPAPTAPTVPDPADLQKYGSIGGASAPGLTPAMKLPELGDSSQTMMSPAQERKLGEFIVRQIRAGGGYLDDPEVNDYLNELGNRLVTATRDVRQDFVFFAVPDPQINAFALPGGFVGVNTCWRQHGAHPARARRIAVGQRPGA